MFGMHWAELLIVLVLATVVFGPKRIPEIGGALGKGIKDFRKGVTEMKEDTGYNEIRKLPSDVAAAITEPLQTSATPQDVATQPQSPKASAT
jgi:sec-independent protein translocase protein TatA